MKKIIIIMIMLLGAVLVGCGDDLTADREAAIASVDEYIDGKDESKYSDADWIVLSGYLEEATADINSAESKEEIDAVVIEYKGYIAAVDSFDYPALRVQVIQQIDELLASVVKTNYTASIYRQIEDAVSTAKTEVNSAKKDEDIINAIYTALQTEINEFEKIDLNAIKTAATSEADAFFAAIDEADYAETEYAAIVALHTRCETQILRATSDALIASILAKFKSDCNNVVKINVDTYKATISSEAQTYFDAIDELDYESDDYANIEELYSTFTTRMGTASKVGVIDEIFEDFKADVLLVEKINIVAFKTSLLATLDTFYDALDEDDYTTANWGQIDTLYNTCVTNINAAAKASIMQQIYDAFVTNANAVGRIDVTAYKTTANLEFTNYIETNCIEDDYTATNWATITSIIDTARTAIDNAVKAPAIDTIIANAKTDIAAVVKMTVAECKSIEIAEIDDIINSLEEANYTVGNWGDINYKAHVLKEEINSADTREDIRGKAAELTTYIGTIATKGLPEARMAAVTELTNYIDALEEREYSSENFAIILGYIDSLEGAVLELREIDLITLSLNDYKDLVDDVQKVDIVAYRTNSINSIPSLYNTIDYSAADLLSIDALVDALEIAITNAQYYSDIDSLISEFESDLLEFELIERTIELEFGTVYGYNTNYFDISIANTTYEAANQSLYVFKIVDLTTGDEYFAAVHELVSSTRAQVNFPIYTHVTDGDFVLIVTIKDANVSYIGEVYFDNGVSVELTAVKVIVDNVVDGTLARLEIIETDYEAADWTTIEGYVQSAIDTITTATKYADMANVIDDLEANLNSVPKRQLTPAELRVATEEDIDDYVDTLVEADYTAGNWTEILNLISSAKTALASLTLESEMIDLVDQLKLDIQAVEKIVVSTSFNITNVNAYATNYMHLTTSIDVLQSDNPTVYLIDSATNERYEGSLFNYINCYSQYNFATYNVQTGVYDVYIEFLRDSTAYSATAHINNGVVQTLSGYKTTKQSEVSGYFAANGIKASDYTSENWQLLEGYVTTAQNAITNATDFTGVDSAVSAFVSNVTAVEKVEKTLSEYISDAKAELDAYLDTKDETLYSLENYSILSGLVDSGKTALDACENKASVDTTLASYKTDMDAVEVLVHMEELTVSNFNPHGVQWIALGWSNEINNTSATNQTLTVTYNTEEYSGRFDRIDGPKALFFQINDLPGGVDVAAATYSVHMQFEVDSVVYYVDFEVVNGVRQV